MANTRQENIIFGIGVAISIICMFFVDSILKFNISKFFLYAPVFYLFIRKVQTKRIVGFRAKLGMVLLPCLLVFLIYFEYKNYHEQKEMDRIWEEVINKYKK